jgi:hypothetical protein
MRKYLIFFILIISIKSSYSQYCNIGLETGYGIAEIDQYSESHFKDLSHNDPNYFSFSFLFSYKPIKPMFNLNSGLIFKKIDFVYPTYYLFKLPIGLEFQIGRKFQFIFGPALYTQLLTNKNNEPNIKYSILQLGYHFDFGFKYFVNDKYSIFIKAEREQDLTKLYSWTYENHAGTFSTDNYNLYGVKISAGILYKLGNKNNNRP